MRQFVMCSLVIATSLVIVSGCGEQGSEQPSQPAGDAADSAQAQAPMVSGTVLETIDAGQYTYVRVDTGSGEIWAAAPRVSLEQGQHITMPQGMAMENFHSDTLDRDFEVVYFVSGIGSADGSGGGSHQMPPGHPPVGTAAGAEEIDLSGIEPAEGGLTVADVYASAAEFGGSQVTVRGKVVKVNLGIMDRNWIHIRDGSGDAAAGSNDLTVTTADTAEVGDTATIAGTLAVDKDFGAGYRYALIVEGATVTIE